MDSASVSWISCLYGGDSSSEGSVNSDYSVRSSMELDISISDSTVRAVRDLANSFVQLSLEDQIETLAARMSAMSLYDRGVGVDPQAQWVFDLLSKNLPGVRWETTIVAMNSVRVRSPFLPESVTGGTPAARERVRRVLQFGRSRNP